MISWRLRWESHGIQSHQAAGGDAVRKPILAFTALAALVVLSAPPSVAAQAPAPSVKSIELPPDNTMATLKPGVGVETVKNDCMICHSTDYIVRQPASDAKKWESEVQKMIKVYGAPISEADRKSVV